jgi:16S rRNA (guanine966-N2)-methyltransferase
MAVPLDWVEMRIIAGEFRGRNLLPPAGRATRPITDRVKQSLFDILTPIMEGANVYDCFAGTGSMGLESLSRGAAHVTFFEADRSAVDRLKKNIASLGVVKQSDVISMDLFRWFAKVSPREKASLVFLDPPYRFLTEQPDELRQLAEHLVEKYLRPGSLVVFRHDSKDSLDLTGLKPYDVREYGGMTIELLSQDTRSPIG